MLSLRARRIRLPRLYSLSIPVILVIKCAYSGWRCEQCLLENGDCRLASSLQPPSPLSRSRVGIAHFWPSPLQGKAERLVSLPRACSLDPLFRPENHLTPVICCPASRSSFTPPIPEIHPPTHSHSFSLLRTDKQGEYPRLKGSDVTKLKL